MELNTVSSKVAASTKTDALVVDEIERTAVGNYRTFVVINASTHVTD